VVDVPCCRHPPDDATGTPREVLALVPYRQVVERGFACHDDGAPLRCLVVDEHVTLERAALRRRCRPRPSRWPTPVRRQR
jgi:phenazine biosynthesis protein phzE